MKNPLGKIFAFIGGAVAGAVAGILLAPKSGKETREDIARAFEEYRDKIKAILEEKGIKLNKEEFEKFVAAVKEKLGSHFTEADVEDAVEDAVDDLKEEEA